MSKPDPNVLAETSALVHTMAKDLVLSDVLSAYDAVERAHTAAKEYSRLIEPGLDLVFRLKGVHESLFRIRADLEEL